ncbi:MAG: helix-turn-helix transcriptional regulator [Desulfotomaculum sp.]|nr:helix-turn-helix transcriptional regulator [Desulfotomaculum sp.]
MFANKLKRLREAKGWTKSRLAQEANISQTYVGELEAGTKQPTIRTLEKIASALGVSVPKLLEDDKSKPKAG